MNNPWWDGHSKAGLTGGLLLTMVVTVSGKDVGKTIILSAVGAATSLLVTMVLKWLLKHLRR